MFHVLVFFLGGGEGGLVDNSSINMVLVVGGKTVEGKLNVKLEV